MRCELSQNHDIMVYHPRNLVFVLCSVSRKYYHKLRILRHQQSLSWKRINLIDNHSSSARINLINNQSAASNMDSSGRDLQQLCLISKSNAEINQTIRQWLEDAVTDAKADLCTMDQFIERDFRMAFNCLLNSYHTTDRSVEKFLNQQISNRERFVKKQGKMQGDGVPIVPELQCNCSEKVPSSLHYQDLKGITALHVAVYRNSLHVDKIAKLLLNWDRSSNEFLASDADAKEISLASIPMRCGCYPLHILTGQNLTINEKLLETLLCADSSIPFKDDVNGDNPISLLWKNTLVSEKETRRYFSSC